jgi:hypothetical protein
MSISKIKTGSITTDAITEAKVADNAISEEHLDATVITGNTELSANAASDDILLIYDSSNGTLKKIQSSNVGLQAPVVSSVSPTNALTGDGTGNHTFTITGTGFSVGSTAKLQTSAGADVTFDSVTRNSSTQITGVIAKSSLSNANEPYDVVVTSGENVSGRLNDQINIDASPVFVTASGSLGSGTGTNSLSFSVNATDPESAAAVTFELQSGTIPPGLSLSNSTADGGTAIISGTADDPATDTTYNFTLRAVDAASNTSSRAFSITINANINFETFTSSGTFAVPVGKTTLAEVLVVAGGGGGLAFSCNPAHDRGSGGGGAGGLIFMPCFPVSPGGTITVTVGDGGYPSIPEAPSPYGGYGNAPSADGGGSKLGSDSVFGSPGDPGLTPTSGVLTAKGGGGGGAGYYILCQAGARQSGGSGGGAAGGRQGGEPGGTGTQPTQPGNSGSYGFGNNGGARIGAASTNSGAGAGGGGAGAVGSAAAGGGGASGGAGRAYTIADGTTPVYYAGGGAGGGTCTSGTGGQGGGGNGSTVAPSPTLQGGQANKGGGAGGIGGSGGPCFSPGHNWYARGGKGVVIVKY